MTEEKYEVPEKELEIHSQSLPIKVGRPWFVYLMAIWSFIGISGFLMIVIRIISQDSPEILKIGRLTVLIFSIFFFVYIIQMRKNYIILFGILCVALALWQSLNMASILISDNSNNPVAYFLLFYIVPSTILATVALRPRFLKLCDNYRKFKKFESIQKISKKAIQR